VKSYLMTMTLVLVVSVACGQDSASAPAPAPAPKADNLAAKGLLHSIMLLRHAPEKPIARAERLVALAEFAARLAPDDPDINKVIAYISLVQNKEKALALAIRKSFKARPRDHALALQWLSSEMKGFQDAQSRLTFLDALVEDTKRTGELRAAAAVHQADILIGQGHRKRAITAFDTAVNLDPYLPAALRGQLTLAKKIALVDRANIWLRELTVNPHSARQAAQLGEMLNAAGLYEQAARFYNYAWNVNQRMGLGRTVSLDFIVQYCNALLNAGKYKQATEIFGPLSRRFSDSVQLRVLLIEAANRSSQNGLTKMYSGEIKAIFAPKLSGGQPIASDAAELAWLYLITGTDKQQAMDYAKRAVAIKPLDPECIKVMAAARILSGKKSIADLGRAALQKIADKDAFATAFLAEHYYLVGRPRDGEKLVLSGLLLSRSGQAARRLMILAKKHKVTIPPPEGARELQALVEALPQSVLTIGLETEKSFALKVIAPKQIDAGNGIVVQVELSSTCDRKVSAGMGGLIPATVSLNVTAKGRKTGKFKDVIRMVLPVGRYLGKGEKVTVSGRIDVGKLHAFINSHPLDDFELTISPRLIDPGARTPGNAEPLPLVARTPGVIKRTGILGKFDRSRVASWKTAYQRSLSLIMGDLKVSDPKIRIRAARQVASLLVLSDGIKSARLRTPNQLTGQINRGVLVLMTAEILKDRGDIVRAEMLASLGQVKLDAAIIRTLGSVIRDPSALVRFRLVELLGASGLSGQEPILKHFAKDKYDLVANLAKTIQTTSD
jgi:tetratricopeptide (TPR) repeat protein